MINKNAGWMLFLSLSTSFCAHKLWLWYLCLSQNERLLVQNGTGSARNLTLCNIHGSFFGSLRFVRVKITLLKVMYNWCQGYEQGRMNFVELTDRQHKWRQPFSHSQTKLGAKKFQLITNANQQNKMIILCIVYIYLYLKHKTFVDGLMKKYVITIFHPQFRLLALPLWASNSQWL